VKMNALSGEEKKYRDLYKEHMKITHQLNEKIDYIKALQYEKTQLVKAQDDKAFSSTMYEEWILRTFYPNHQFLMNFIASCLKISSQEEQGRFTTRSMNLLRADLQSIDNVAIPSSGVGTPRNLLSNSESGANMMLQGPGALSRGNTGMGSRGSASGGGGSRQGYRPGSAALQQPTGSRSSSMNATTLLAIFDDCNIVGRGELLNYVEALRVEKLTLTQGDSYHDMNPEDKTKLISLLDNYAQLPSLIFELVRRQDDLYDLIQKLQEEKEYATKQIGLLKAHFAKETRRMNEQLYEKNAAQNPAVYSSLTTKKAPLESMIATDEPTLGPSKSSDIVNLTSAESVTS
jgi:hypothetical protein